MLHACLQPADLDLTMNRAANRPVFREGDTGGAIYQVETGCIRLQKLAVSGHRCVLAFCHPGDLFGLGLSGPAEVDAEAVCPTRVSRLGESGLARLLLSDQRRALVLMDHAYGGGDQFSQHIAMLGHAGAEQKLSWFLLRIARRLNPDISDGLCVDLPMMRTDIADHLGMTLETVSREMTKLRNTKVIELVGQRGFILTRPAALVRLARGDAITTGSHDNKADLSRPSATPAGVPAWQAWPERAATS
jgi:CRP/FNR family transcriptional regulator, anaerobic regulatory protein